MSLPRVREPDYWRAAVQRYAPELDADQVDRIVVRLVDAFRHGETAQTCVWHEVARERRQACHCARCFTLAHDGRIPEQAS